MSLAVPQKGGNEISIKPSKNVCAVVACHINSQVCNELHSSRTLWKSKCSGVCLYVGKKTSNSIFDGIAFVPCKSVNVCLAGYRLPTIGQINVSGNSRRHHSLCKSQLSGNLGVFLVNDNSW